MNDRPADFSGTQTIVGTKIVTAPTERELAAIVEKHRDEGWVVRGEPIRTNNRNFAQTLVRFGVRGRDFAPG